MLSGSSLHVCTHTDTDTDTHTHRDTHVCLEVMHE